MDKNLFDAFVVAQMKVRDRDETLRQMWYFCSDLLDFASGQAVLNGSREEIVKEFEARFKEFPLPHPPAYMDPEEDKQVVVEVTKGVAEVTKCPVDISVKIVDHDSCD